jgi:hypothetical protein
MNVVDANGETEMDENQWEAASTSSPLPLFLFTANGHGRHIRRIRDGEALTDRAGPGTDQQVCYCTLQNGKYHIILFHWITDLDRLLLFSLFVSLYISAARMLRLNCLLDRTS